VFWTYTGVAVVSETH